MIPLTSTSQKALNATFRYLSNVPGVNPQVVQKFWTAAKEGSKTEPPQFTYDGGPQKAAAEYLAYNLVRKDEEGQYGIAISADLEKEAVSDFLLCEQRLAVINRWGKVPNHVPTGDPLAPESIIAIARRKIAYVLGSFSADQMVAEAHFSSGASTRLRRKRGQPPYKFEGKPHVTRNCALLAVSMIWHSPVWRSYCQSLYGRDSDPCTWVQVVEGSEYFTVPKTFNSVRGATKEPCLNMYLQKGIGRMLRSRLKRIGVNLNDQSENQRLAAAGARTGSLATIDLAAASDSVSVRIVQDLLPSDWVRFIMYTRSECVKLPDGSWHTLEKISSMGNGFTFELESLIFWALSSAAVELTRCTDRRVGVYGDDIIVHHSVAPALLDVLGYLGFIPNRDKTYVAGPFRESCGKHYWQGFDVSPFNVKNLLESESERYHYLNRLRLWGFRVGLDTQPEFRQLVEYLIRLFFPKGWRAVPPHLGTKAGMLVRSVAHAPGIFFCLKRQGYVGERWAPKPPREKKVFDYTGYLAWFGPEIGEVLVTNLEKGSVTYRRRRFVTSEWTDCDIGLIG